MCLSVQKICQVLLRNSTSLNEGLSIKNSQIKELWKEIFFLGKDSLLKPETNGKSAFHIGQELIKKYGLKLCFCYSTYRR